MATIRDVAKKAGVSVATVSRVLNQNGYVNAETEKKVMEAIQDLNYKPNAVARSLFKKKSKTVGLIVPDITNPFFPEIARAVEDITNSNQYTLIQCNSDEQAGKEKEYLEVLKQKYVDGVILISNTIKSEQIRELDIPVVFIDRPNQENIPTVVSNNYEGAKRAVHYLQKTGCRVIAHIKGPDYIIPSQERLRGYLEVVKNESWFHDGLVAGGHYQLETAVEAAKSILLEFPEIDGIFAGNDIMAIGVLKAVQQLGKKVPEDVSIVGFDGIAISKMTFPELTTIAQPIYQMGALAAEKLIQLIEGEQIESFYEELEVELVKRQTTRQE